MTFKFLYKTVWYYSLPVDITRVVEDFALKPKEVW